MTDTLQRFLFDHTDIRGEHVRLDKTYADTLNTHRYPAAIRRLIGEFLAAAALLSVTLKFEGRISLQARSDGEIPLIMAEATSDHTLRAIARGASEAQSDDFHTLLNNGHLTITVEPNNGKRYQGIVALDGDNLAQCLEAYFLQSEQIATRIWLTAENNLAAGLMLQQLPSGNGIDAHAREEKWEHIIHLTDTVSGTELQDLDSDQLLYRLYNQETVRIFPADSLEFKCSCSRDRTLRALVTVGQEELADIITQRGQIETNCEFCHQHYQFTEVDIKDLFEPQLH